MLRSAQTSGASISHEAYHQGVAAQPQASPQLARKNYEVPVMIDSADDAGANAAQLTSGLGKD